VERRTGGPVNPGTSPAQRRSTFSSIVAWSEAVDAWLNYAGMVFIMLLMLLTLYNVAGRLLFNSPFRGYIDAEEMMMALLVFLSLAYCQQKSGHIRFELFMTRVLRRGFSYHLAEAAYLIIALIGFTLIAVYSLQAAIHSYTIQDVTPTVHWPIWPAQLGTAIGSIFLCIRLVIQTAQSVVWAATGTKRAFENPAAMG
jgi:TRAP-type C4-dicarboxylate transport system permease small subunit